MGLTREGAGRCRGGAMPGSRNGATVGVTVGVGGRGGTDGTEEREVCHDKPEEPAGFGPHPW